MMMHSCSTGRFICRECAAMGAGYGRARNPGSEVKMGEQRHGLKRKRDDFDADLENTDDEQSAMGFDPDDDNNVHDGGVTSRGGSGKEFVLDAPRVKARSSDDMTITWRVHRDPRTRDVRDVTCYKVCFTFLTLTGRDPLAHDWSCATPHASQLHKGPPSVSCRMIIIK